MKRFEIVYEVDADTEEEAFVKHGRELAKLASRNYKIPEMKKPVRVVDKGFIHPDGTVREYDIPPEGFVPIPALHVGPEGAFLFPAAIREGSQVKRQQGCSDELPTDSQYWELGKWKPVEIGK